MKGLMRRIGGCAVLIGGAVLSSATTTDLAPTADVRMLSIGPTTAFGGDTVIATYNDGVDNIQNSVLRFDMSSIPASDVITSATLNLWGSSVGGPSVSTTNIFRVTNPWSEMETTWLQRQAGVPWTNPGGDAVGTTGVANVNPYATWTGSQVSQWYSFNVTQLVAEWHVGTHSNFGLLMRGPTANWLVYASKENTEVNVRPYLSVTHEAVPEPATLLVSGIALLALRRRRSA